MADEVNGAAAPGEEGTVNWQGAKDFFEGRTAPTEESAGETATDGGDGTVEISIRGVKTRMTPEAAEAYNAFVRDVRERDGRLGGEIAQLRERVARTEGTLEGVRKPTQDDLPSPPKPELAIEDFAEYHRQMLAYHGAMMARQQVELETKVRGELTGRDAASRQEAATRAWVDRFYSEHPHLNKPAARKLVQAVYSEHAQEIDSYGSDVAGAHARLAELAEQELASLRGGGATSQHNRPPRLEGAGNPSPGTKKPAAPSAPFSAADWSARKRAALAGRK